jgi:hypothetical protein
VVSYIALGQAVAGFVDLLDQDDFDFGGDVVLAAEIDISCVSAMPPIAVPSRAYGLPKGVGILRKIHVSHISLPRDTWRFLTSAFNEDQ